MNSKKYVNLWIILCVVGFDIFCKVDAFYCGSSRQYGSTGRISSPSTRGYTRVDCSWTIYASTGKVLQLSFSGFALKSSYACSSNYIKIYDGTTLLTNGSDSHGKFCGTRKINSFTSTSSTVRIVYYKNFYSYYYGNTYNFIFSWRQIVKPCSNILTSANQQISCTNENKVGSVCTFACSRGYRLVGETTSTCNAAGSRKYWTASPPQCRAKICKSISAYKNQQVSCTNRFNFGSNCTFTCIRGYSVNGTSTSTCIVLGNEVSWSNLQPHCRLSKICSPTTARASKVSGTVSSPNYPNEYFNVENCFQLINVPKGNVVYILFSDFDLQSGLECNGDYMEIYDGNSLQTLGSNYKGKFCGKRKINSFVSTSNSVKIIFHGNSDVTRSGFRLYWRKIPASRNCPNNPHRFYSASGSIYSPNHPNNYFNDVDCTWEISISAGKALYVKFSSFTLEKSKTCDYDYVRMYDGADPVMHDQTYYDKLCGNATSPSTRFILTSSSALIHFHSDSSISRSGFRLSWEQIPSSCSNLTLTTNQQISCTNEYKIGSICTFTCSPGYTLIGKISSTCKVSSNSISWSSSQPKCQVACQSISITNGQTSCTDGSNVNSVCTYSCSSGYRLIGSSSSRCIERSRSLSIWSTTIPRCQGFCSSISITKGRTSCTNDVLVNSVCTHSCTIGYKLVEASSTSQCIEQNGSPPIWSTPILQCQGYCPLINIENGQTSCTDDNNLNSVCTHSCSSGYRLMGLRYSTCVKDSGYYHTWSPVVPICQGFCSSITIENGQTSCSNGDNLNSVCSHSCSRGYRLIGSSSSTCIERSVLSPIWSPTIPKCEEFCYPINIANGKTLCTNGESINSVCTHSCSRGYRLMGSSSSRCIERSGLSPTWSTSIPICQGFCSSVSITNGRISCTNGLSVNSVCSHSCSSGNKLVGSAFSRCTERCGLSPTWTPSIPRCLSFCPVIHIENGHTSCSNNETLNSICTYFCSSGYRLVGSSSSRCIGRSGSTLAWSRPIPRCQGFCRTIRITNGQTSCTSRTHLNSICSHSCSRGYRLVGSSYSTCIERHGSPPAWSPSIPTCQNFCPYVYIANGRTSCTDDDNINSVCSHSCSRGYKLVGSSSSRCIERSGLFPSWSPSIPKCQGFCSKILILNGQTSCTNGFNVNSVCTHSCSRGYRLKENTPSRCTERNGTYPSWSPLIPECIEFCPVINIQNGQTSCTDEDNINSTCTHSCLSGYRLVGSPSSRCIKKSRSYPKWSTIIPKCQGYCSKISIVNGQSSCSNGVNVNSVCSHSCSSGYRLVGSSSSKCTEECGSSPTWSTSIPKCQSFCPTISITNGQTICSDGLNVNSLCTHSCSSGYTLVGAASSRCTERNASSPIWSTPIPTCQGYCPTIDITNGQVSCIQASSACYRLCLREAQFSSFARWVCLQQCGRPAASQTICPSPSLSDSLSTGLQTIIEDNCFNGFALNTFCYFSCSPDFALFGSRESRCEERKGLSPQWSSTIPHCKGICPSINVANGLSDCTNGRNINSECTVQCDDEYEVVGEDTSICLSPLNNSSLSVPAWLPGIPTCTKICPLRSLQFGQMACSNNRSLGSICTFQCDSGYELIGNRISECINENNMQFRWNQSMPLCKILCPKFALENGQTICSMKRSVSSTCNLTCNSGYELIGSNTTTCNQNRTNIPQWIPAFATCQATCSALSLPNGTINCTNNESLDSVCHFGCETEYELIGESSSTCILQYGEAEWSYAIPACRAMCSPISISNGQTNCSHSQSINSTCTHSCSSGYRLVGSVTSTCTQGNESFPQWDPSIPHCEGFCPNISITNGMTSCSNGRNISSKCNHTCGGGYGLVGSTSTVCEEQVGSPPTWMPVLPQCQATCSSASLRNGNVACTKGNSLNSTCTFNCDNKYELQGSNSTSCLLQDDGQARWIPNPPKCQDVPI